MKPWLILAAYKLEVEILLQNHHFTKIRKDHFEGEIGGYRFNIQIFGQGKVQVALMGALELMKKGYEGIILVGSAGALCPRVQNWIFVQECLEIDFKSSSVPIWKSRWSAKMGFERHPEIQSCRIVSTEQTIVGEQERLKFASQYSAEAVAWESAGFYRLLKESEMVGFELRYISDREADELQDFKLFKKRIQAASARLPFYIQSIIKSYEHQKRN
jgi:nucleoside phosphorylase